MSQKHNRTEQRVGKCFCVLSPCRRGGVRVKRKSGVSPVTLRGSDRQHARCDGDSLSRMTSSAQADNKDETEKKKEKKSRGEKIKFYLSAAIKEGN